MNAWRISAMLVPAMAMLACKAAIADTPQIEKPVATSSESPSGTPRRFPAQRVPKNVATTKLSI